VAAVFQPIAPRQAPNPTEGFVPWIRHNLLADWKSAVTTVVIVVLAVIYLPEVVNWTLFKAVFRPNLDECQAARGTGACWGQ
jgi:general L-amino acid transport system permease protein